MALLKEASVSFHTHDQETGEMGLPVGYDYDTVFEAALRDGLSASESIHAMRAVQLEQEDLADELRSRKDEVWMSVAAELAAMVEIEERQRSAIGQINSFERSRSRWIVRGLGLFTIVTLIAAGSLLAQDDGDMVAASPQEAVYLRLGLIFLVLAFIGFLLWLVTVLRRAVYRWRLRASLKPDSLTAQLAAARETLARALVDKGIMPEIRKVVNDRLRTSYSRRLVYLSAEGLREASDSSYEVPTPIRQRLAGLLEQRSGGTIGITGPRGAGKTTLIRSLCPRDSFANTERGSLLSIVVSAPVQYDAREFLLYLFGTLCRTVLGAEADQPVPVSSAWARVLGLDRGSPLVRRRTSSFDAGKRSNDPVPLTWARVLRLEHDLELVRRLISRAHADKPSDDQSTSSQVAKEEAMARLRIEADDKLKEIEWQQTYSTGWSGSLKLPGGIAAAEAAKTSGRQLTRRQRTYPQIVDDLRTFLSHAAAGGRVLIGIDELDKIESAGAAQAFLNDLKALFGIDRCFFLISVSEDALGDFQRRALGFRNVFDSSFDDIVRVPYLSAADSMLLLERRVIGLPSLFVLLCHCLSGGLPRDLIRVARNLIELDASVLTSADISRVCVVLVQQELAANAEAVAIVGRIDRLHPDGSPMLLWANQLAELAGHELLDHCRAFLAGNRILGGSDDTSVELRMARARSAALTLEMLTLAYYYATVVDFFTGKCSDEALEKLSAQENGSSIVDRLAKARQALAVHPAVAWNAISSFRADYRLDQLPYPDISAALFLGSIQTGEEPSSR
ncbi:MAG: CobW-like GTP-binding protein [Actinomycetota bacterium]|nr:CobW-like GTP-binding protein [Actinomycetota bacterium]